MQTDTAREQMIHQQLRAADRKFKGPRAHS